VAYDIDGTRRLLDVGWSPEEIRLAEGLPGDIGTLLLESRSKPAFSFMDRDLWHQAHGFLLDHFTLGDAAWESLAFRLWLTRVLAYTTNQARTGFDSAMAYLEDTISEYERRAMGG
jgi:hypothetical protein